VTTGLYIGRFQPFHLGQLEMVTSISKEVNKLIIAIGSAQYSHTVVNPFTAGERYKMIKAALSEYNLAADIIQVPDNPSNSEWVATIESYSPAEFDVVYTNEPLSRRLFWEAGYDIKGFKGTFVRSQMCGTNIRKLIILDAGSWITLVPKSVLQVIADIDGVHRIRDLAKSDNP
jgi:nicotinamide-nucleotide adenylyltransferase